MRIDILTLFPEMFSSLEHSIVGRARKSEKIEVNFHNFRDFATNTQKHVDDMPYGGGQGMLLMPQPIFDTMASFPHDNARVLMMDPAGRKFDQAFAEELATEEQIVFLCGHYEGFDERIKTLVTDEVSLGDYVLTGGEVAAAVMIDATVRLIPDVLGKKASHEDDSFSSGLLEYPQYSRFSLPDLRFVHKAPSADWEFRLYSTQIQPLRHDSLRSLPGATVRTT